MNTKQRAESFKAFKKANEDTTGKMYKIIDEAQDIISKLYKKRRKGVVKINVVDALNIDFHYEQILHTKYSVSKMPLYTIDMEKDGTEEEFSFVFQRLNDLMETAKSSFEKIKHLNSKYELVNLKKANRG